MKRRSFLATSLFPLAAWAGKVRYPEVTRRPLVFPRDFGAHPEYRSEWWYVTGWLEGPLGFQITFFRARPKENSANASSFNPRQLLFAHAALSDRKLGHLVHDERAAREWRSLAGAEISTTQVWIDDWSLSLEDHRYHASVTARDFEFQLTLTPRGPVVLQGDRGYSRKGYRPEEASYYYSVPHLAVAGKVNGRAVDGSAWLDHEWSSAYLAPEAAGWDWTGINLDDGGSLMAFEMRAKAGGIHYAPPGVTMRPLRWWQSPRTGVRYPVSMEVNGLRLEPLMDDQELDVRATSGTIYWEGAVRAYKEQGEVGRGYLELTGYWKPMKL